MKNQTAPFSFRPIALPAEIANAIGSNMFEGFVPTKKNMKIINDLLSGKLSDSEFVAAVRNM
jgi:hypothetical protein